MTADRPTILSVEDALRDARYIVPVYQRAYAWGEDEIATLLRDVHDYRERHGGSSYYIGSLVTYPRGRVDESPVAYEVVDGQQRLTTLFIILAVCDGGPGFPLDDALAFEGRSRSTDDLKTLASRGASCDVDELRDSGIKEAVETIRAAWDRGEFSPEDLQYLLTNVRLVRTTLPKGTDLNHYFEVMNSRGEQLEKHEIVKARLMSRLSSDDDAGAFARIWDACTDMGKHVQSKFDTTARTLIFGDSWDGWRLRTPADLFRVLGSDPSGVHGRRTLAELLSDSGPAAAQPASDTTDETERSGAIIDFPNFLQHVLALTVRSEQRFAWSGQPPTTLDDKNLVETFESNVRAAEDVQRFAFNLLRAKYHFDRYVIKTDRTRQSEDDSNWILRQARKSDDGNLSPVATFGSGNQTGDDAAHVHVMVLQSMFQVTDSRRSYKNFLYAILEFLADADGPPDASDFIDFLAGLAESRYRTNIKPDELDCGTSVPHFALNYLDYLIWRHRAGDLADSAYRSFRFRYRGSVEHFYPQHPDPESQIEQLARDVVDRFGNLCLMSRSENSKRSNDPPTSKIAKFRSDRQSLKFQVMTKIAKGPNGWAQDQIEDHGRAMLKILERGIADAG